MTLVRDAALTAMQTRTFALEPGGLGRLQVDHGPGLIRLCLDGAPLGEIDGDAALSKEPFFSLPDGSILRVGPAPGEDPPLVLTRNGRKLPRFARDADQMALSAGQLLYVLAAGVGALSAIALVGGLATVRGPLMLGKVSAAAAVGLALCGFLVSRRSRGALWVAMGVFLAFGLAAAARAVNAPGNLPLWPVPLWLLTLPALWRAVPAMRR